MPSEPCHICGAAFGTDHKAHCSLKGWDTPDPRATLELIAAVGEIDPNYIPDRDRLTDTVAPILPSIIRDLRRLVELESAAGKQVVGVAYNPNPEGRT